MAEKQVRGESKSQWETFVLIRNPPGSITESSLKMHVKSEQVKDTCDNHPRDKNTKFLSLKVYWKFIYTITSSSHHWRLNQTSHASRSNGQTSRHEQSNTSNHKILGTKAWYQIWGGWHWVPNCHSWHKRPAQATRCKKQATVFVRCKMQGSRCKT